MDGEAGRADRDQGLCRQGEDPARTDQAIDTASAISGGVDTVGQNSDWTIINNIFYDVDHVFLNKGNMRLLFGASGSARLLSRTGRLVDLCARLTA